MSLYTYRGIPSAIQTIYLYGYGCQEQTQKIRRQISCRRIMKRESLIPNLSHICKPLYRFCKIFYGFICIAVFNAVPDTVLNMSLQNNLPYFVEG